MDNVNAMLSFVYTLLTNQITSALESVGLDPCVGYLHTERPGRASLALDLIEEFRAVYADRFVLSLINKKIVNKKNFTKKENGAVLMDDDSRKKLLMEKRSNHTSILKGKGRMGNGSLCSGYVIGEIFKRRFRWLSSIFVEMR